MLEQKHPGGGKCERRAFLISRREGDTERKRGREREEGSVRKSRGREMGKEGWREKGEGRLII